MSIVKATRDLARDLKDKELGTALKDTLEKYLDANPCSHCGGHYDDHIYLTNPEIEAAERDGWIVSICDTNIHRSPRRGSTSFLRLSRPVKDPCDEDFMKEISS